jgi:hypothetical protein
MDSSLLVRAAVVQALLVAALFAILIALPLDHDFFEDYGWIVGPASWVLCAAVAARILPLPSSLVAFAAVAGGVAGGLVGLVTSHTAGLVVAIAVFAASCAGYDESAEPAHPETQ